MFPIEHSTIYVLLSVRHNLIYVSPYLNWLVFRKCHHIEKCILISTLDVRKPNNKGQNETKLYQIAYKRIGYAMM